MNRKQRRKYVMLVTKSERASLKRERASLKQEKAFQMKKAMFLLGVDGVVWDN